MKIGIYTTDVPESLGGGFVLRDDLERAAIGLKGRHQFELVTTPPPDPVADLRFPVRPVRKICRLVGIPYETKYIVTPPRQRLEAEILRRKFDLLWFNNFDPLYLGVPYILNIFDLQHRLQPWFPEVSANGQWEHRESVWADGARRAAAVTVGSQEAKEQLCHFYGVPLDNVWVLPFPTPQKAIDISTGKTGAPPRVDVRSKYGLKRDFLFYPAQFWPHKNHVNLLHALAILRQRGREMSLVLTGSDHGNQAYVESIARELNIADLVHFCGFVPYEDILSFYFDARALAYVSFFGPENLPPLEAMALGCPVILSDIPGVRSLHGDGPVLVQPRNPQSIADGIEYVLDHPDQMKVRIKEGKNVAAQDDSERYMVSFQRMLDELQPIRRCWP